MKKKIIIDTDPGVDDALAIELAMGAEELNILGLNFEFDLLDLAVEVPLFGRYEFWYLLSYLAVWPLIRKLIRRTRSKYLLV